MKFYIENYEEINNWADDMLKNFFSNIKIRILFGHLYNPELFSPVTLMSDSKDMVTIFSREETEYRPNKSGKSNLISRKNGWRNAGKTNFVIDVQEYAISLSHTVGANETFDGKWVFEQKFEQIIDKNDVMVKSY